MPNEQQSRARAGRRRQNQKEATINDQVGQLDAGLTDKVDVALTGTTSPLVLSDAQALRCMVLKLTGTHPSGAYEVHCPRTGIPVSTGTVLILYCDGTDVIQLAGGGASFVAGDRLAILNEDPADATLADLSLTCKGRRT